MTRRLQFVWWGWRPCLIRFRRFTGALALLYAWELQIGPFDIRRWKHSPKEISA